MKRVLLTGASGFIGAHCLAPLLARGYEVHAVSRTAPHPPPPSPACGRGGAEVTLPDLQSRAGKSLQDMSLTGSFPEQSPDVGIDARRLPLSRVRERGAGGEGSPGVGVRAISPETRPLRGANIGSADILKPETPVAWHHADLLDPEATRALLQQVRPTHLLHLAWVVTPGAFWTSPLNRPWLDASLGLLAAFGESGGQRAVMVGTCAEYAPSDEPCVEGVTPLAPKTVYGAAKGALSIMLPAFGAQAGVPSTAWARLFYLYGPGEPSARLVPAVIQTLLRDEPMPCSHGEQVRDFLYVEDVAEAMVALLDSEVNGAVNIASGEPVTLKALLSAIGAQMGREHLLQFGARPAGPDEPPVLLADVTRLRDEVGWTPRTTLADGVRNTIAWWQQQEAPS